MNRLNTIFFALCASALLTLAGCGRVVGAECRDGLELCGETCCPTGMCSSDRCEAPLPDAGPDALDAGVDADAALDLGIDLGADADGDAGADAGDAAGDMGEFDAGPPEGCEIGTADCDGECVNLEFDEANCGACGNECAGGEVCVFGDCQGVCPAPNLVCDGDCIDAQRDPNNCGECGTVCETAICRGGVCRGPEPGHVVLIGHDYSDAEIPETRLLGSAAFIPLEDPLDVLVYVGESAMDAEDGALMAIDDVATAVGRDYRIRTATADQVPARLLFADAFVVLPQDGEDDVTLERLGREWSRSLNSFLARTGVVIVLDAGGTTNDGTWQILRSSGLLQVDGRESVAVGTRLEVIEPTDAVARDVPLSFDSRSECASFTGTRPERTVVLTEDDQPVVIHRFVIP